MLKKFYKGSVLLLSVITVLGSSCTKTDYVQNPNAPTQESVLRDATRAQIGQLGVGVQSVMPDGVFSFRAWSGSIGREIVYFAQTESRYYRELQGEIPLDAAGIMYGWYLSFNQTRRRAEIMLQSAQNTSALSDAEKAAAKGFGKTVQAYAMLNCLNMMGNNGIRTSFSDLSSEGDLLKPGCFKNYTESLTYLKGLADEGLAALEQAGSAAFPFTMVTGWGDLSTVEGFKKFNRAVAARIAMYQKDWTGLETALNASFMDLDGDLQAGPEFMFSNVSGDVTNPLWRSFDNTGTPMLVQSKFIPEAETGDKRVFGASMAEGGIARVREREEASAPPDYPLMSHEVQMYATNTSPIKIIRNEELVLMYAEAKLQKDDLSGAVAALDIIREGNGLQKLATAKPAVIGDKAKLIDELLQQRRYSLFMEGHRWFDMRRYDKLNTLPLDKATHSVFTQFLVPKAESDWDSVNPCQ
ncbi:RagB/SusD family nutrient uptake outer membrane protein [Flavihumibacter stibioxidans]|uniref:RagB/SusD domain-containing protein n=1 Tax=Flavihumibacter stibioxidans TaxID=1834163 RepID=A0ABR7M711_9BACT|nr:RagB/SusD family nutrient uptake outer membrane protein [Flavihumibacter stibioxidans]MBC6490816.1 hypothetical protein [Flavihumibacter stibioxidans]